LKASDSINARAQYSIVAKKFVITILELVLRELITPMSIAIAAEKLKPNKNHTNTEVT
jgi:hypothetical protein